MLRLSEPKIDLNPTKKLNPFQHHDPCTQHYFLNNCEDFYLKLFLQLFSPFLLKIFLYLSIGKNHQP